MTLNISRRQFLRGATRSSPVRRPPWTGNDITDLCSRCDDCVAACPEQILFRGDGGFPEISFAADGCTLCGKCAEVCQQAVFHTDQAAFPWQATIADNCLARANVHCQSCQDACEVSAIRFHPALGCPPQPTIDFDACNGCGACLAVCPADAVKLELINAC